MQGEPIAWLRDLDGTGSLHVCSEGDPGAIAVYEATPSPKLRSGMSMMEQEASLSAAQEENKRLRKFLGKVQGVCLGVAMSGKNHPDPDGALMNLFQEAWDILFPPTEALSAPSKEDKTDGK